MISEDVLSTEYLGQDKPVNKIQPVVSVCVITYNHASFIEECLDSILMQETDFPFEIIIGEDNSTDGTRDICKRYADQHPDKIRLFLRRPDQKIEVNGKKSFHFNFIETIKSARGEYIALCDGDDYWTLSNKLSVQIEFLTTNYNFSICFTNCSTINDSGEILNLNFLPYNADKVLEFKDLMFIAPTLTRVFRNDDSLKKIDYNVTAVDAIMLIQLMNIGNAKYLNINTANYRKHLGGVWSMKAREDKLQYYFDVRFYGLRNSAGSDQRKFLRECLIVILKLLKYNKATANGSLQKVKIAFTDSLGLKYSMLFWLFKFLFELSILTDYQRGIALNILLKVF